MQETIDIDWFLKDDEGFIAHIASGGGRLPKSVTESESDLEFLIKYFRNLPEINADVVINPNLDRYIRLSSNWERDRYLGDFIRMAKKGVYSFDKTHLGNFNDDQYHLVATPIRKINFNGLPPDVKVKLEKTAIHYKILNLETFCVSDINKLQP